MTIDLSDRKRRQAESERTDFARVTSVALARVVYHPESPGEHLMGLGAYAAYLTNLHGWDDRDWLRS